MKIIVNNENDYTGDGCFEVEISTLEDLMELGKK